jgi:hypothetical protein
VADEWVGLSDAIAALHTEIQSARDKGRTQEVAFDLGEIQVEFMLEVVKEGSGQSGVNFGVVSFGARGGVATGSTHRVTLTLKPRDSSGRGRVSIADEG